jgi:hypothetical protein
VVTNATPSVITVPLTAVVQTPVSVLDEGAMAAVDVMPNPTADICSVSLPGDRAVTVAILDAAGHVVTVREIALGTTKASIDVSELASGAYQVMVQGDGLAKSIPLVIVR